MPTPLLAPEVLAEAVALVRQHGTVTAAAEAASRASIAAGGKPVARATFDHRYKMAVMRGFDANPYQAPVPTGHVLKGVSTYLGRDGEVRGQWVKTRADEITPADLIDAFNVAAESVWQAPAKIEAPASCDADLMTVYPIADLHLGMFAWGRETGGADYDLGIASGLFRGVMKRLIARAPASALGVVLWLGDAMHADNALNRTERSGHPLDVDTRYSKVLEAAIGLMIESVVMALSRHDEVLVRILPGNHDPQSMLMLSIALKHHFQADPRVTVDTDPGLFWWYRFGTTLLGAHHGHTVKAPLMPGLMAASRPKDWGQTLYRYVLMGHVHHSHKGADEAGGVQWETFQTIAPRDAYHAGRGYVSGRSMKALTFHRQNGREGTDEVNLPPLAVAA